MSVRYSDALLLSQQQDALRRVRQRQEHAQRTIEQTNARAAAPSGAQEAAPAAPFLSPPLPPGGNAGRSGPGSAPGNGAGGVQGNAAMHHAAARPSGNILSQLFGGAQRPNNLRSGPSGHPPQPASRPSGFGGAAAAPPASSGGLLELLRAKGMTDSFGSLGDTLQSTVSSVSEPLSKLLDAFDIDGEKLIILIVMWIVFNERGDKTLLLALGYLLL
ncbi:MAG: hypothetical protein RR320_04330 [Oscillospiraceae bacterium]